MTEITCNNCGKKCEKPSKEINRQKRNGKTKFYCSLSCSTTEIKTTTSNIELKCLWCDKSFLSTTHKSHRTCCSKMCSVRYAQSKVDPVIHKLSLQGLERIKNYPKQKKFICVICGNSFTKKVNNGVIVRKTCSKECYSKLISKLSTENPNCGGETNYKKYRYRGIWMDSTWERDLAEWMDFQRIIWERSRKKHMLWWTDKEDKRRYYPDFYLPQYNIYVDTKNPYLMKCDDNKIKSVIKENNVKIVCGNIEEVKKILTDLLVVV